MEKERTELFMIQMLIVFNSTRFNKWKITKQKEKLISGTSTKLSGWDLSFKDVFKSLGSFGIPEGCFGPVHVFVLAV